jgi:hypothetical protein
VQPEIPKVFVSHASEDKERFVLEFATKLRAKGIDAWIDRWEMLPGDSLVTKMFEEGIKDAQAMIVVISEYSVNKKWVRAEMNVGVVNQIEQASRLIPVIIGNVDDSEIPQSLKDTLWERIEDLNNYDAEFESIVRSIYGRREKPQLGDSPAYVQLDIDGIPGLTDVDSFVFKLMCEELMSHEHHVLWPLNSETFKEQIWKLDISEENLSEIIEVLENRGYIEVGRVWGGGVYNLRITDYGLDQYARMYLPEYENIIKSVALEIANHSRQTGEQIAKSLEQPRLIVDHILRELRSRRYIKAQESRSGDIFFVLGPTAEMKRWLRET